MVDAEVTSGGDVSFDGQIVGRLQGFRFTPEASTGAERTGFSEDDLSAAIAKEFEVRANRLSEAVDGALVIANDGAIRWLGDPIAKLAAGEALLKPRALLLADEALTGAALEKAQTRLDLWLAATVKRLLGPLFELEAGIGLEGAARNVAQQLAEALGVLERGRVAQDVKTLDQNARALLRKLGVRFGAYYIYLPAMVKPAIRVLATQLWALRQGGAGIGTGLDEIPQLAASGRTSFLADSAISRDIYRVAGFRLCGDRAVRVDIVERLADLIRPAVAYRPGANAGPPPAGAADGDGFVVTGAMTSLTGCSGEHFASVLRSLGYASERVKGPALTLVAPAPSPAADEAAVSEAPAPAEGAEMVVEGGVAAASADESPADEAAEPVAETSVGVAEVGVDESPENAVAGDAGAATEASPPELAQSVEGVPAAEAFHAADSALELEPVEAAPSGEIVDAPEAATAPAEASEPAAAASSEVSADAAASAEAASAPVEEVLIEVWRPRPPPNRQRHPRGEMRRGASAHPRPAPEGEARAARSEDLPARARNRPRRPIVPPSPAGAEAEAREPGRGQGERGNRRPSERPARSEAPAGRRHGKNRGGRPEEREEAPPPVPRREPPINLDSPFAKLLALKSQLEAKGKGG